ncbi:MAG: alpha-glucan family phosphorylase [Cyclobacteriaceae bacterium]|nr:alpha-glucan family phosphorylase [Cyclobacteriaceae bacterium]
MIELKDLFPYSFEKKFSKPVAYFSMEFAIDQALKIYSGGLGFLSGSHLRSAYELKQNFIGIGILWKYGYYDQSRSMDGTMKPSFVEKDYSFLTDTGIIFPIRIHNHEVKVKAMLLKPEVFGTAPLFLLTTDLPENDHLAQTISHRLYDAHESARIAQSSLLGYGGAKLLDILHRETEIYHLNEGHALPLCFYLWDKYKSIDEVKRRVVFTTHTPEVAGNEEHDAGKLEVMSFFDGVSKESYQSLIEPGSKNLNYTLAALRMSRKANAVSKLHGKVSREMWTGYAGICEITSITNAQNHKYWHDPALETAFEKDNMKAAAMRKAEMKKELFQVVSDQTGKLFDPGALTIVWARRFAGYKRANLLLNDLGRFFRVVNKSGLPCQVIWAGKPYPEDKDSNEMFNDIMKKISAMPNCAILTGYELKLSALLKRGSDVWLNNPKIFREASGTSGMTAAMNGSVNLSIPDGWVPEFANHGKNCFSVEPADRSLNEQEQNAQEASRIYDLLENVVLPVYYNKPEQWYAITRQAWMDVREEYGSNRMAREYYDIMYS